MPHDLTTPAGRDELRQLAVEYAGQNSEAVVPVSASGLYTLLDLADAADKLQRFKDWVHAYLDAKGIPHHPLGTHGAEGCRIGDRMDYVFAKLADAGEWRPIESAPKDRPIWLHDPTLVCEDFNPSGSVEGYWQDTEGWIGAVWNACQDVWDAKVIHPTHWRALPPPPARAAAAEVKGADCV